MTDLPKLPTPEKRRGFTPRQVAAVFIKCDGRCQHCQEKVKLDGYQIDHIHRRDALGEHTLENWQLLCKPCHAEKTRVDNYEAKKGARIRGEKGQRARRAKHGSKLKSNVKLQSRGFSKRPDGVKHKWAKRKLRSTPPN